MTAEDAPRLTPGELAAAIGCDVAHVAAMVEAGVMRPAEDGSFEPADIIRGQVATSLGEAGLTLDLLRQGIEAGFVSFEQTALVYPAPTPRGELTLGGLAERLGTAEETLLRIVTAFGLPRPEPDERLDAAAAEHLASFVDAWRPIGDDDLLVRAARAYGEGLRRAAEGWVGIFEEAVMWPMAHEVLPWPEMSRRALVPGVAVLRAAQSILPWLLDRHLTERLNRLNFESVERRLALSGIAPPPPARPAAIVFTDLAGYTRLTVERGDETAAAFATRLAECANDAAIAHDGRLVKLLGDGVMLHFARPSDAVAAAIDLRAAVDAAGLPPAHTGIDAGAVIRRESDFFGRTVNVASRLSSAAGAGEILVTSAVVAAAGAGMPPVEALPPLELKGIPDPVAAFRVAAR